MRLLGFPKPRTVRCRVQSNTPVGVASPLPLVAHSRTSARDYKCPVTIPFHTVYSSERCATFGIGLSPKASNAFFCRFMLRDLAGVFCTKIFLVPGLLIGGIDLLRLGVVNDMGFKLGNLGHPRLQLLDTAGNAVKASTSLRRPCRQIIVVGQIVVDQKVERFCRPFQIENLRTSELYKHLKNQ